MKTRPKKRKLCRVAMARCAATRSSDRSLGIMYTLKQSSHATYPRTRWMRKMVSGDIRSPFRESRFPVRVGCRLRLGSRCISNQDPQRHEGTYGNELVVHQVLLREWQGIDDGV